MFIENDIRFNIQGNVIVIRDENLLYQAALKILQTRIRSNPFQAFYGSSIVSRIGTKAVGATATLLTEDVQMALRNLQSLQTAQAKYQAVTAKERLYTVSSVNVTQSQDDLTVFLVDVVVLNASNQPVSISIVFSVPGVVALAGSNGLSLGLDYAGLTQVQSNSMFR